MAFGSFTVPEQSHPLIGQAYDGTRGAGELSLVTSHLVVPLVLVQTGSDFCDGLRILQVNAADTEFLLPDGHKIRGEVTMAIRSR